MLQDREIAVRLYIQKLTTSQKMDSIQLLNIVFRFCFIVGFYLCLYLFIFFELPFIVHQNQ